MRVRIYQLAKELDIPNKILVQECQKRGLDVKSHSSSVDEAAAQRLREELGGAQAAPAQPAPAAPPAKPKAPTKETPDAKAAPPKPEAPSDQDAKTAADEETPAGKTRPRKPKKPRETADEETQDKKRRRKKTRKPKSDADQGTTDDSDTPPAVVRRAPAPPTPSRPVRALPDVPDFWRPGTPQQRTRRRKPRKPRHGDRRRRGGADTSKPVVGKIEIIPPVSVREFSQKVGLSASKIIQDLLAEGAIVSINDMLHAGAVEALAQANKLDIEIKPQADLETQQLEEDVEDKPEDRLSRAPVVTFLGHVDHGKTSLLDYIRKTNVTASEEGGITQHMGAYKVALESGELTFLDTPGHEAFTEMRARGAQVTDLVVLVVAIDDGVMPQTVEAINHARAAEVPIIVALNKCDLPGANSQRAMQQLAQEGLNPEQWGGDTVMLEVSALTGQGIEDLLEMLVLEAELLELKANPNKAARGTVLESNVTPGEGVMATVLVREGTLRRGDYALAGICFGRIRSLYDDQDRPIKEAGPSTPVKISGLDDAPDAGDRFIVTADPQRARELVEQRRQEERQKTLTPRRHVTLETLFEQLQQTQVKEASFILKADGTGSIEVLTEKLQQMGSDEVKVRILHSAVGGVTESDVLLADASDAIIIGFHVLAPEKVTSLAEQHGVQIKIYHVIYHLLNEVHLALEQMLEPEQREIVTGHATILQVFRSSRLGSIAGCRVTDGTIERNSLVRIARDNIVIHESRVSSLRRGKDDVAEVTRDMECGIRLVGFDDFKEDDVIEAYRIEEVARKL